jgi:tripartite-type tricarboxylate transporter receptor subunit TctC
VIDRLQKAVAKVMQQPEIRNKLLAAELDPVASASSEAEQRLRADQQKWGKVAAQIGLQLD